MGVAAGRTGDGGSSLPPAHAGQRPPVQHAHGVHPTGQAGHAVGSHAVPPGSVPAGQGDEQSAGPATDGILGGTAGAITPSPSGSRWQPPTAVLAATSTEPVR